MRSRFDLRRRSKTTLALGRLQGVQRRSVQAARRRARHRARRRGAARNAARRSRSQPQRHEHLHRCGDGRDQSQQRRRGQPDAEHQRRTAPSSRRSPKLADAGRLARDERAADPPPRCPAGRPLRALQRFRLGREAARSRPPGIWSTASACAAPIRRVSARRTSSRPTRSNIRGSARTPITIAARPMCAPAGSPTSRPAARGIGYSIFVSGNPDLKPENSTNWTAGIVLEPQVHPRPDRAS